jgi:hypothetical protein
VQLRARSAHPALELASGGGNLNGTSSRFSYARSGPSPLWTVGGGARWIQWPVGSIEEFDAEEYTELRRHCFEPAVVRNFELPGSRILRCQTRPPRVGRFPELKGRIRGLTWSDDQSLASVRLLKRRNAGTAGGEAWQGTSLEPARCESQEGKEGRHKFHW